MQKKQLSGLMDGETLDEHFLQSLSSDKALQDSWQSYHLIRDTMRGDIGDLFHLNIAHRVAAVLECEPIYPRPVEVLRSQPTPQEWQNKIPFWAQIRPWAGQMAQVGVAACVSLAVIVGVQQYNNTPQENIGADSPVLNTLPIGGLVSPVSYGVSTEVSDSQMQQLQEQRKRINAMLQDYELQRRLQIKQLQMEQKTVGVSNQVTGVQPLRMPKH